PLGNAFNGSRARLSVELIETPYSLENQRRTLFSGKGDESPNVKWGKKSRTDGAEGTDSAQALAREIGTRPRSTAGGLSLTGWRIPPFFSGQMHLAGDNRFGPRASNCSTRVGREPWLAKVNNRSKPERVSAGPASRVPCYWRPSFSAIVSRLLFLC